MQIHKCYLVGQEVTHQVKHPVDDDSNSVYPSKTRSHWGGGTKWAWEGKPLRFVVYLNWLQDECVKHSESDISDILMGD